MIGVLLPLAFVVAALVALLVLVVAHVRFHRAMDREAAAEATGPQWPPLMVARCTCGYEGRRR